MERVHFYYHQSGAIIQTERQYLNDTAYELRADAIRLISMCNWGHPGGSLSLGEVLAVLFGGGANLTAENCREKNRDYIVLSKAHCSPAFYAALKQFGFLTEEEFYRYGRTDGYEGHLLRNNPYGVDCNGGSLGLGLSYCVGLAAGLKLKQQYHNRVFCICGDGELNEGQMWEAAMCAAQNRLDNLVLLVDYNKVMAKGFTHEEIDVAPLDDKFRAFGFNVQQCDGHNVDEICAALYQAKYRFVNGHPNVIILHTVKGRGVEACEFNYKWHTHAPDIETANRFLKSLADAYGKEFVPITHTVKGKDPGMRGILEEV